MRELIFNDFLRLYEELREPPFNIMEEYHSEWNMFVRNYEDEFDTIENYRIPINILAEETKKLSDEQLLQVYTRLIEIACY